MTLESAHTPPAPLGWKAVPLKAVLRFRNGQSYADVQNDEGPYPVYGSGGIFAMCDDYLHDGASVLFGRKGTINRPLLASGRFWCIDTMFYTTVSPSVDPRFIHYFATTLPFDLYSTDTALPSMTQADLGTMQILLPDLEVQRTIADFLDHETARIGTIIQAQRDVVALLLERQAAQLSEQLVGQWQHLEPLRLARHLRKLARPLPTDSGVVTAYRDGVVTLRELRREDGYTFSDKEDGYQGVAQGDLVFHALDGFAGAVGVALESGKCSPVYHVCAPEEGGTAQYFALLLRALGQTGLLTAYAWSVRQRSVDYRNWDLFASIPVHVPDRPEQDRIVAAYGDFSDDTDKLIGAAHATIDLMLERRDALISAAVSGGIDPITGTEYIQSVEQGTAS